MIKWIQQTININQVKQRNKVKQVNLSIQYEESVRFIAPNNIMFLIKAQDQGLINKTKDKVQIFFLSIIVIIFDLIIKLRIKFKKFYKIMEE
ncbi:unnamed protein product [Paramecium octaurelia]|uniref:Transmembrane protein n=1 Tax=Paramecium octaurelia TaxID=43137 RepID=A0A8S1WHT6_PAROT|nr:unnamed protein product [Paramecium octaurelia]